MSKVTQKAVSAEVSPKKKYDKWGHCRDKEYWRKKEQRRSANGYYRTEAYIKRQKAQKAARMKKPKYILLKRVHSVVKEALRQGKLVRGPCEVCGTTTERIHGHHDSYLTREDWLKVRWLCHKHHREWHYDHDPVYPPLAA